LTFNASCAYWEFVLVLMTGIRVLQKIKFKL